MEKCFYYTENGMISNLEKEVNNMWFFGVRNMVNFKNERGDTLLIIASKNGHLGIVEMLIDKFNCNLNLQDDLGNSALLYAVKNNYNLIAKLLLDKGGDPNLVNYNKDTPMLLAIYNNNYEIISNLLFKGVSLPNKEILMKISRVGVSSVWNTISYFWNTGKSG